jgi:hypothetical protein
MIFILAFSTDLRNSGGNFCPFSHGIVGGNVFYVFKWLPLMA